MSGFSPEWLALREPVDHRSRDEMLARRLEAHFAGRSEIDVVDLGCGAGSNLRGTFARLPVRQRWTLVDYDARLLAAARSRLTQWADRSRTDGEGLVLEKGEREIAVTFRQADLNRELEAALGRGPTLVTAAAFFDLTSAEFIGKLVAAVAARKAVFYTVLTYNGQKSWSPQHPADAALLAAFNQHQLGDKGFGPAVGPVAPVALATTLQSAGYHVAEGDSPWELDEADGRLIADLAAGFAAAAGEVGTVDRERIAAWSAITRTGAMVGHTDTLAYPLT